MFTVFFVFRVFKYLKHYILNVEPISYELDWETWFLIQSPESLNFVPPHASTTRHMYSADNTVGWRCSKGQQINTQNQNWQNAQPQRVATDPIQPYLINFYTDVFAALPAPQVSLPSLFSNYSQKIYFIFLWYFWQDAKIYNIKSNVYACLLNIRNASKCMLMQLSISWSDVTTESATTERLLPVPWEKVIS